jgi:hypothetical protein
MDFFMANLLEQRSDEFVSRLSPEVAVGTMDAGWFPAALLIAFS